PIRVARVDASNLILAEDVVAAEQVPPFANTAVDGYAVRAADVATVPVELRVIGELAAGAAPTIAVVAGTAIRIMTGAPIPEGCDAVVMVEDTERLGDDGVRIRASVPVGAAIRAAGSDVVVGSTVLQAGTRITPMIEGVLASINATHVLVYPRVRVGVLSTGDELVDDGSPLAVGQIRESNRTMLLRIVEEAGATAIDLGIIRDNEDVLEAALRAAVSTGGCDALVTSGGVSMGDYDVVKAVLSRIADMNWVQIAMKPAKPFAFGSLQNPSGVQVPIFGLPGNPVSSLVSFELLARPALRTMMGFGVAAHRPVVRAISDDAVVRHTDGKVHYDRVHASWGNDGRVHVSRKPAQGSHQLAITAVANALMAVPDGDGIAAGAEVMVTFLGADGGPTAQK
ncbi:MAG: gephyrin-like molybdotransferase Glp, partial [Ilumatobacteraceae bacterium]